MASRSIVAAGMEYPLGMGAELLQLHERVLQLLGMLGPLQNLVDLEGCRRRSLLLRLNPGHKGLTGGAHLHQVLLVL